MQEPETRDVVTPDPFSSQTECHYPCLPLSVSGTVPRCPAAPHGKRSPQSIEKKLRFGARSTSSGFRPSNRRLGNKPPLIWSNVHVNTAPDVRGPKTKWSTETIQYWSDHLASLPLARAQHNQLRKLSRATRGGEMNGGVGGNVVT